LQGSRLGPRRKSFADILQVVDLVIWKFELIQELACQLFNNTIRIGNWTFAISYLVLPFVQEIMLKGFFLFIMETIEACFGYQGQHLCASCNF
jgi:hypothetical protein